MELRLWYVLSTVFLSKKFLTILFIITKCQVHDASISGRNKSPFAYTKAGDFFKKKDKKDK
jgi:hypothetical protein